MKKRLFGHFGFVYSEIFSHASGMQNVSKLNHVYAKLQQIFVLNTRQYQWRIQLGSKSIIAAQF